MLAAGLPIDQWIPINLDMADFAAITLSVLRRTRYLLEVSVDTGLPGKTWMFSQVQKRIDVGREFALLFFDIDRFKSVNDIYGFGRSGDFLRAMATALHEAVAQVGRPHIDIAHIGGDDFLAVCDPGQVLNFSRLTVEKFETATDLLYDFADRHRGYLEMPNRWGTGKPLRAALVTLSIGVAQSTESGRRLVSAHVAGKIASEMERIAKSQPGSFVCVDRRSLDNEVEPIESAA